MQPLIQQFEIRKAQHGDEEAIAKVHIQAWQEAYRNLLPQDYLDSLDSEYDERFKMWQRIIKNPQRWAWVAVTSDQIVGFVLFGPPRDENRGGFVELGAIYLLEKYKGCGIGLSMLNIGFKEMESKGYQKAYCWVLKGNPTIQFYESTGAKFGGQTKADDIGGKKFDELAYEWSQIVLFDR